MEPPMTRKYAGFHTRLHFADGSEGKRPERIGMSGDTWRRNRKEPPASTRAKYSQRRKKNDADAKSEGGKEGNNCSSIQRALSRAGQGEALT